MSAFTSTKGVERAAATFWLQERDLLSAFAEFCNICSVLQPRAGESVRCFFPRCQVWCLHCWLFPPCAKLSALLQSGHGGVGRGWVKWQWQGAVFKGCKWQWTKKKVCGAILDHDAWLFLVDTTVLEDAQTGLCLLPGTLMLWVGKGTELPWDCAVLDMLDRTEKLSCEFDTMRITVIIRVRSVLFPRSYNEKLVREQHSKSGWEWPEKEGAWHFNILHVYIKYFSDLLQLINNLYFK